MYFVYILKSLKDNRTYTGFAKDVGVRFLEHNKGKVNATKNRLPFQLIFVEKSDSLANTKNRELYWKSGAGRRKLKDYFIKGFPPISVKWARLAISPK